MLVSIVIDNFDYGRFVGEAIASALAQSHPEVEVVVVDDGSTDESRAVIAGFGGRVRPVLKANGGQGSALNAGFAAARGALVHFLDADDTVDPGLADAAVAEWRRTPFAKLHWPLREVAEDGRDRGRLDPPARLDVGDLRDRILARGPGAYVTPPMSGNLYARPVLERILPVPEDVRMCADGFLYDLAPLFGRVAALAAPHGTLRKHESWFGAVPLAQRLPSTVRVHRHVIARMAERARELGHEPDEAGWAARSWPLRQARALEELEAAVPAGTPIVLVDEGRFGLEPTAERPIHPLTPGLAADAAWAEIERSGARHVVVAWPAFDWLRRADGLERRLREAGEVALANERLLVVALP